MNSEGLLATGDAELPTETLQNSGTSVEVVLTNVKDSSSQNVVVVSRRRNGRLDVWSSLVEEGAKQLLERGLEILDDDGEGEPGADEEDEDGDDEVTPVDEAVSR